MNLSERIQHIVNMITNCGVLADIGTDHGYIPIFTILNDICSNVIASDINEGPIKVALKNINEYNLAAKIDTRIGPGLSVLKKGEADAIVIAGMGGDLIANIIRDDIEIAKSSSYMVLQPVQHPEHLRRFLIENGFTIIDEDLVKDENKYYHIIKVIEGKSDKFEKDVYYYTGLKLIEKKHPVLKDYINSKLNKIHIILNKIDIKNQSNRYNELIKLKRQFEDVLECL